MTISDNQRRVLEALREDDMTYTHIAKRFPRLRVIARTINTLHDRRLIVRVDRPGTTDTYYQITESGLAALRDER